MANPLPGQHSPQNLGAVKGTDDHVAARARSTSKSKIPMSHPTLKPKTSFKTRAQGSQHGK